MLLTKDFVFIHLPKTGGTFVHRNLVRLFLNRANIKEEGLRHRVIRKLNLDYQLIGAHSYQPLRPHQTCADIPKAHQRKQVLSVIRNPIEKWISEYNFGFWKRHPQYLDQLDIPLEDIRAVAPTFGSEQETFTDFMRMHDVFLTKRRYQSDYSFGYLTEQFIRFYCKNADDLLRDSNLDVTTIKKNLHQVHFLRNIRLNQDLFEFLCQQGFQESSVRWLLDAGRELPEGKGFRKKVDLERFFDNTLLEDTIYKERLLIDLCINLGEMEERPILNTKA